ncbi:SUR7/PalI family-domain-containing protein [Bombardia bombarda]|uniref:SUR7/PalI family-domain-containing protein n=1 Tax=Bombardia bombarda TaxID=252184 RepID=A0AA39WME5_9PEZI|nr:SUR7/PalI family-domain-containing protein [Bombardia bombarda]
MGNLGRYVCVALPFLLTLGSLIALLVAGLGGVADKSLFMFRVNTTDLSISPKDFHDPTLLPAGSLQPVVRAFHDPSLLPVATRQSTSQTTNITAGDLGLYDLYDVGLWGYCFTTQNGTRDCTKPAFNWAQTALNRTTTDVNTIITTTGQNVTLPSGITDAVSTFTTVARWTEIVFIIAYVALGVELFFGLFANCSRAFSCITFIIALVATVAVCGAAALATAMSVVVVGAVESSAKVYGVSANFNTRFLAAVWIGAAFAVAAGFFWMFTVCCCAPDRSNRGSRKNRDSASEKLMHGPYQPINQPTDYAPGGYAPQGQYPQQSYGAPRRDIAYEPYKHSNV